MFPVIFLSIEHDRIFPCPKNKYHTFVHLHILMEVICCFTIEITKDEQISLIFESLFE